jgi:hypothetical protein
MLDNFSAQGFGVLTNINWRFFYRAEFFILHSTFFQRPFVSSIRMTMAMRRKKSTAMFPKPRPDFFTIGLWQFQFRQGCARKKLKPALPMHGRHGRQFLLHLKQKHQPVSLAFVAMLAHNAGQMQIHRREFQCEFLLRLAARAGIGRLADVRVQFPAARTPQAAIRFLRAFKQQDFIVRVETVEQRGDFIGQRHRRNVPPDGKPEQEFFLNADLILKGMWGINSALYAARIPRSNGSAACLNQLNPISNESQIIDLHLLHTAVGFRDERNAEHFRFFSQLRLLK